MGNGNAAAPAASTTEGDVKGNPENQVTDENQLAEDQALEDAFEQGFEDDNPIQVNQSDADVNAPLGESDGGTPNGDAGTGEGDKNLTSEENLGESQPDPLADAFAKFEASLDKKLEKQARQFDGKLGTAIDKFKQATEPKEPDPVPVEQQVSEAVKAGEKFQKLSEEFPDIGDGVGEAVNAAVNTALENIAKQQGANSSAEPVNTDELRQQILDDVQDQIISAEHPDWKDITTDIKFHEWAKNQEGEAKRQYESEVTGDAIKLLRTYKNFKSGSVSGGGETSQNTGTGQQNPNKRLEDAVTPTGGGGVPPKQFQTEEEGFEQGFAEG